MKYNHWTELICTYATRWVKLGGVYKLVWGNDMLYTVIPAGTEHTNDISKRIDVPNYTMSLYLNKFTSWQTIEEQKVL